MNYRITLRRPLVVSKSLTPIYRLAWAVSVSQTRRRFSRVLKVGTESNNRLHMRLRAQLSWIGASGPIE
jgi:hypothetical protein